MHFLIEIVPRRPRTWKGDVEALYEMLERYGEERLIQAVQAAQLRSHPLAPRPYRSLIMLAAD